MNLLLSDPAFLSVAATVSGGGGYDPDAQAYITTVEAADGQALETAVKDAINVFVVGCKTDGIWNAIKASCILAGARTLSGALVPLKGTAPTNYNFVAADYDRKTGLVGNASTKYLDSNRNNNADPQDDRHVSIWVHTASTSLQFGGDIGYYASQSVGNTYIGRNGILAQNALSSSTVSSYISTVTGFRGLSRNGSSSFDYRASSTTNSISSTSLTPYNGNIEVFRGGASGLESNARLSFYSIGESLDLALLDTRVTTLISAFSAAIP